MRATVLIKSLQHLVDEYGDRDVEVNGMWNTDCIITPYSFFEINDVDIFSDSNNFQLLIKNG